jgi:sRNA-binding carbon storage regulator CsrA
MLTLERGIDETTLIGDVPLIITSIDKGNQTVEFTFGGIRVKTHLQVLTDLSPQVSIYVKKFQTSRKAVIDFIAPRSIPIIRAEAKRKTA